VGNTKVAALALLVVIVGAGGFLFYNEFILQPRLDIYIELYEVTRTQDGYRAVYKGQVQNIGRKMARGVMVCLETASLTTDDQHIPAVKGTKELGSIPPGALRNFEIVLLSSDRRMFEPFVYSVIQAQPSG